MFDKIRIAIKESFLVKILLGLLVLSFGVFGIGDFIGTGGMDPNIAMKVGKREVNILEFQSQYDRQYAQYKEMVGGQVPDSELVRRSVMDAMVQQITRSATLDAAAEDLGVVVTDDQLRRFVRELDFFKDTTGNFSQINYGEVLRQMNLTESAFLDLARSDIRARIMLEPLERGSQVPQYLVDSLFTYRAEGRTADTLLVRTSAITITEKPSDDELKAIYDQNTPVFMQPEFRALSILVLKATDLVKPDSFAEDELKAYYDANAQRFRTPAVKRVQQLNFETKDEADKVRAMAAQDDTLETLAKKAGRDVIDLGDQAQDSFIARAMGAAYELPVNEVSPVTQTELGWHIFSLSAATPEQVTAYEDAKATIRMALAEDRGLDAVYSASTDVQDALAAGTPMAEIAKSLGLPHTTIEAVDQSGRTPNGSEVPDLLDRNNLLVQAFSLPPNGDTGLRDLPDRDGYYIAKVEAITPAAPKPFEDVRGELISLWLRDNTMAEARKVADGIAAEIGASTALADLATKDNKVTFAALGPVTRDGRPIEQFQAPQTVDVGRMSTVMLQKLFSAKPGEVFTADVGEGVLVARMKDIVEPPATGVLATQRNQMTASLRNAVTADLFDQMNASFAAQYPVEVNQTVIDQMVRTAR